MSNIFFSSASASNVFSGIGGSIFRYFEGIFRNISLFFKMWYKRFFDAEERRNYFTAEGTKLLFIIVYILVNVGLAIEAALRKIFFFV